MKKILISIFSFCLCGLLAQNAFAVETGGNGGNTLGGGPCNGGSGCYDGCGWMYYSFTSASRTATISDGTTTTNVDKCSAYNGFYFSHYMYMSNGDLFGTRTIGNCLSGNKNNGVDRMHESVSRTPSGALDSSIRYSGAVPTGNVLWGYNNVQSVYEQMWRESGGVSWSDFARESNNNDTYFCYNSAPPTPTYDIGFSPSVSITPNSWSGVSSVAGGYSVDSIGNHTFTRSYTVQRSSSPSSPASADTGYALNGEYESSGTWNWTRDYAPGARKQVSSDSYTVAVDWNSSDQICASLQTWDVSYTGTNLSWGSGHSASNCVWVYGPDAQRAKFEGAIKIDSTHGTVSNGSDITKNEAFFTGTGFRTKYSFMVYYYIRRVSTSGDRPANTPTNYNYQEVAGGFSESNYPTNLSRESGAYASGSGWNLVASQPIEVTIGVGNESVACFYLSYKDSLLFHDSSTPYESTSNGRVRKCLKVSNPKTAAVFSYGGRTAGTVDSHDLLEISSDGLTGKLINQKFDPTTGSYINNFPSNHRYSMTFLHRLTRTDDPEKTPVKDDGSKIADCANTTWSVKYKSNGGSWQTPPTSWGTTSGTSCIRNKDGYVETLNKPFYNLAAENDSSTNPATLGMGTVITVCEKLVYNDTISYTAYTHERFGYGLDVESTQAETTPVCITLMNPAIDQTIKDGGTHVSKIVPTIDSASVTGAAQTGSRSYSATALNITIDFNHTISRVEDTSFVEPKTLCTAATIGSRCFSTVNGSMYDNPFFIFTTNLTTRRTITGDGTNATLTSPESSATQAFSLQAHRNWSSGSDWSDSSTTTTQATLGATSSASGLLAGKTKEICETSIATPGSARVYYEDVYRKEVYSAGDTSATTDSSGDGKYAYTRKKASSASLDYSADFAESTPPYCIEVTRERNFRITQVTPSSTSTADPISSANQAIDADFTLTIDRDDTSKEYVTDPDVEVTPITYVITEYDGDDETGFYDDVVAATGGGTISDRDYCGFFSGKLGSFVENCSTDHTGTWDGTANGGDGVYGPSGGSYIRTVNYSPDNITVPADIPPGAKFCVAIAITPLSSSSRSGESFISRSICTNVSKKPAVHVWGGSVQTNASAKTSISDVKVDDSAKKYYGSWVEFALVARGEVKGLASGAALVGGYTTTQHSEVLCSSSKLTIANSQCYSNRRAASVGESNVYRTSDILAELKTRYLSEATDEDTPKGAVVHRLSLNGSGVGVLDGEYLASEEIGNEAGEVTNTDIHVIYSPGDLDIRTDVNYLSGNFGGRMNLRTNYIPATLIIAEGNVRIYESVSEIDAWIIAGGTLDTCAVADRRGGGRQVVDSATTSGDQITLSTKICNLPLRVNGPVVASHLFLKRTASADYSEGEDSAAGYAELFNYPASAVLFGSSEAARNGEPQVTYVKSLAPRY